MYMDYANLSFALDRFEPIPSFNIAEVLQEVAILCLG